MKRHKGLSSLSSDHHRGLLFAKYLRSSEAIPASKITQQFKDFFNNNLLKHFAEEEELLVPPLKNEPLILKMLSDHIEMRRLYDDIVKIDDKAGDNLKLFGRRLEEHIRFEERELFPMIERTLPDEILNKFTEKH